MKPIKTEQDYKVAMARFEQVFDAVDGTPEADEAEILATLIGAYDDKHHQIDNPHPIDAIEFVMEQRDLTRNDLVEMTKSTRGTIAKILNRNMALSLEMIRVLSESLSIPIEVLAQRYQTYPYLRPGKRKRV